MTLPFIVCAAITTLSAAVSLGFSLIAVQGAAGPVRTIALYASARSVALMAASLVPFATGATQWLLAVAWCMVIVQAGDAAIGATVRDTIRTYGPAGTALANLLAMIWLMLSVP